MQDQLGRCRLEMVRGSASSVSWAKAVVLVITNTVGYSLVLQMRRVCDFVVCCWIETLNELSISPANIEHAESREPVLARSPAPFSLFETDLVALFGQTAARSSQFGHVSCRCASVRYRSSVQRMISATNRSAPVEVPSQPPSLWPSPPPTPTSTNPGPPDCAGTETTAEMSSPRQPPDFNLVLHLRCLLLSHRPDHRNTL